MNCLPLTVSTLCVSTALFATKTPSGVEIPDVPQTTAELTLEPDEGWWGFGSVFGSRCAAPFGLDGKSVSFDNRRHCYANQTAPFLVSNRGRYVWCEEGFNFAIKDGKMTLTSNGAAFETAMAGATLKEAYLTAAKKHFPASGKMPPAEFFSAPHTDDEVP